MVEMIKLRNLIIIINFINLRSKIPTLQHCFQLQVILHFGELRALTMHKLLVQNASFLLLNHMPTCYNVCIDKICFIIEVHFAILYCNLIH